MMIFDECRTMLADIGNELVTFEKQIGVISQKAARKLKDNPAKYLTDSARELTEMGIRHPVLDSIGGDAPCLPEDVQSSITMPVEGNILYVDLIGEYAQHSGIYIGNGEIAELSGKGCIQRVGRSQFISGGMGYEIYVSCRKKVAIGSPIVAQRARRKIRVRRNYNIVLNNCHQFCAGCLSGNFENSDIFFVDVKARCKKIFRYRFLASLAITPPLKPITRANTF